MPCFIYINEYPGIGKLTITLELQKVSPGAKVFHNHLIIDPVAALVDCDSPEYHTIRTRPRRHVLDIIATSRATQGVSWIFTDSRSSDPIGSLAAQDYKLAAERRGAVFIPVILDCNLGENLQKVVAATRTATTKLTDPKLVQWIHQNEVMYRFGGKEELQLDITEMTSSEVARRISQHVNRLCV
ncbi:hypothetical protein EDB81DRAFT_350073 [Dactylonectria macrodidyma]|uniref:Uncharacterized protein n=1 Tax=Dactylonectria macrodidyma TaxID=307937 RepID=A0A9P9FIK7_9HYPO|nr:hypothetical protein EDB81DRAFT_350073 [Dactylonectria macrodidyma]